MSDAPKRSAARPRPGGRPLSPRAFVAAVALLLCAACTPDSSGPSILDQVFAPEDPGRFAYVANNEDSTISIFAVTGSGRLRQAGYFPFTQVAAGPIKILQHPSREYLLTLNLNTSTISVFQVDETNGRIEQIGGQVGVGLNPTDMVVTPNGAFVYTISMGQNLLTAYQFDEMTGELTQIGQTTTELGTGTFLVMDPFGRYLVVANSPGGRLQTYELQSGGSAVGRSQLVVEPGVIGGLTVDRAGNNLYVTIENFDVVVRIQVDTGNTSYNLTLRESRATDIVPEIVAGPGPVGVHPSGRFLYVLNQTSQDIFLYRIAQDTSMLETVGLLPSEPGAIELTFEPEGNNAYLVDAAQNRLIRYGWNFTTGELEALEEIRVRQGPIDMAFLQDVQRAQIRPRNLYVSNRGSGDVSSFAVDPDTGLASEIGMAAMAGLQPVGVAADPLRRYAFVASAGSREVRSYQVAENGALMEVGTPIVLTGTPTALTLEPSARYVYVVTDSPDEVQQLVILEDGTLFLLPPALPVGDEPAAVAPDPTGQWLYVANSALASPGDAGDISIFAISSGSGLLSPVLPDGMTPGGPTGLGLSPNGARLYTTLFEASAVQPENISSSIGTLTASATATTSGQGPVDVALAPTGRYAYVAARDEGGDGVVQLYDVRASDGALVNANDGSATPRQTIAAGLQPVGLTVDPGQQYLYVINEGSSTLSTFSIALDGTLSQLGPELSTGLQPSSLDLTIVVD